MEIEIDYSLTNLEAIKPLVLKKLMPKIVEIVQGQVDLYLQDLEKHMGVISGVSDYTGSGLHWQALDEETIEDAPKYWYKTGKAKRSIAVNIQLTEDSVQAFVGIAENAPGYQEALWNELGFTPRNGDTIVRRPLFFPLAEEHLDIVKEKIKKSIAAQTLVVEI